MKRTIVSIIALATLALLPLGAEVNLKVAAFVPQNSPWDAGLKRLAAEFERISGGQVRVTFPQSLKGASESDMIQKLKIGLDGALLSTSGLAQLDKDTLSISMPSVIANDAELHAVLQAVEPMIKAAIDKKGYTVLLVTRAGWVRLYGRSPVNTPEDVGKLKVSVPQGDELIESLFQSLGSKTVKGDFTQLFLQLQTGAVDVFYTSPVMVAGLWSQFKGKVSYISPAPIAPYIAALVFSKKGWEKVPAEFRPQLEAAAQKIAADMEADGAKMESDALANLLKEGMKMPTLTPEYASAWGRVYESRPQHLASFSPDFIATVNAAVARVRAKK